MLSRDQAKAFYDRFGAKQDSQAFYEDRATGHLVEHAALEEAGAVFEFGCGTGRFAEKLLEHRLPIATRYHGVDLSTTMVGLAKKRLERFGDRAQVHETGDAIRIDEPDGAVDRVISNFVLDLLTEEDIDAFVAEARRALSPEGRLCIVGLTPGRSFPSKIVTGLWSALYALRPTLLGGCRPVELLDFLPASRWEIRHTQVVVAYGVPSEVVIATPSPDTADSKYGQVA